MITLELSVECPDEASARALMEAVGPDNGGYVESELHGCEIVFRMGSESAGTLRNTADDLMACLKTASEAAGIGRSGERSWNPRLQKSRNFVEIRRNRPRMKLILFSPVTVDGSYC